jgi:hypothetical protein
MKSIMSLKDLNKLLAMILFDELSVSVADPILIKKTKMFLD